MESFLDRLVNATHENLEKRKKATPLEHLMEAIDAQRPAHDFVRSISKPGIDLIAEIKRASPSKGALNASLDAAKQAIRYQEAGASAVSVLTEPTFFQGSVADLASVATAVTIPVLRKDFVVDRYQIYEARAFGADAVLLIAAILSDDQLSSLLELAGNLGMAALVEVHNEQELERVVNNAKFMDSKGCVALGVNNRNLADFSVDLATTLRLRGLVPADIRLVSESGISSRNDVLRLEEAGVDAILVGEALVTSDDPGERIRYLLGW